MSTLRAFQSLVLLISCLAVAQFVAQLVVDGRKLIMFYGMIPDFLLGYFYNGGENTIHPLEGGSSILKSNGLFLQEPSTLSTITALGILIEVLEFGRGRYLLIITLAFLVAYSGTGFVILLFLLLAGLRHGRAALAALLVFVFALALFATGVIDLSAFSDRVGEFQNTNQSGFQRFVGPFWLAAKHLETESLVAFLIGEGPGTTKAFTEIWYSGLPVSWYKMFYDYGIMGSFVFVCFVASCLRRSRCPGIVVAALIELFVFQTSFMNSAMSTIFVVLCTLSGPEAKRRPASAPMRQIGRVEEGTISGTS
jgi:hypothetical protein